MSKILVADVMTRNPVTAKPDLTLLECAKVMVTKKVGSLLIVEGKKFVGFISQRDILWAITKISSKKELSKLTAKEISPKKLFTISSQSTIEQAIKKIKSLKFERLPVVDEGNLVGLITVRDILNFNPEIYPELDEFSKIREESEKLGRIKQAKQRAETHRGVCEECGNLELLYPFNGMLLCENCRDST